MVFFLFVEKGLYSLTSFKAMHHLWIGLPFASIPGCRSKQCVLKITEGLDNKLPEVACQLETSG